MNRISNIFRYIGAVLALFIGYGISNTVATLIVTYLNSDARGWVADHVIPYFVAAVAGFLGVVGALALVEWLFPYVRLRTVAWSFIAVFFVIWLLAILGLVVGNPVEEGLAVMAVQSIVAVITIFKLSSTSQENVKVSL